MRKEQRLVLPAVALTASLVFAVAMFCSPTELRAETTRRFHQPEDQFTLYYPLTGGDHCGIKYEAYYPE